MKYESVIEGRFVERINRFVAIVEIGGEIEKVHVKNTGRCKELFIKGVRVYLEPAKNPDRKTRYSIVALYKGDKLINIDSQIPNACAYEALFKNAMLKQAIKDICVVKREVTYKNSRFDLYFETSKGKKGFIEVKGVTLEVDGIAKFPDAPTVRGVKHVRELIESVEEGYESYILLVVQMKPVHFFVPNALTDPDFAKSLKRAKEKGVGILCFDSIVKPDSIVIDQPIEVKL